MPWLVYTTRSHSLVKKGEDVWVFGKEYIMGTLEILLCKILSAFDVHSTLFLVVRWGERKLPHP